MVCWFNNFRFLVSNDVVLPVAIRPDPAFVQLEILFHLPVLCEMLLVLLQVISPRLTCVSKKKDVMG